MKTLSALSRFSKTSLFKQVPAYDPKSFKYLSSSLEMEFEKNKKDLAILEPIPKLLGKQRKVLESFTIKNEIDETKFQCKYIIKLFDYYKQNLNHNKHKAQESLKKTLKKIQDENYDHKSYMEKFSHNIIRLKHLERKLVILIDFVDQAFDIIRLKKEDSKSEIKFTKKQTNIIEFINSSDNSHTIDLLYHFITSNLEVMNIKSSQCINTRDEEMTCMLAFKKYDKYFALDNLTIFPLKQFIDTELLKKFDDENFDYKSIKKAVSSDRKANTPINYQTFSSIDFMKKLNLTEAGEDDKWIKKIAEKYSEKNPLNIDGKFVGC